MLTPDQKALVLSIWAYNRKKRGEPHDVRSRIKFNWPSLGSDEQQKVWDAYQRRSEMKAPSSPKRPPKHVIRCELGHRLYIEQFVETNAAKVFLDTVLKDEPIKWVSSKELTAKGGVLKVTCEELEDIMEFEPKADEIWKMPENVSDQITAFLRGRWTIKVDEKPVVPPSRRRRSPVKRVIADGMVTIQEICGRLKLKPHKARALMRGAKWKTPDGGWIWPKKEVASVEKKLKALMS